MNKTELAAKVAEATKETNKKAAEGLTAAFAAITEALAAGDEVAISDFGRFGVRGRPSREGRNPRTGEKVDIPAKRVIRFKPALQLKTQVESRAPAKQAKGK